jgi:hypothetical protein
MQPGGKHELFLRIKFEYHKSKKYFSINFFFTNLHLLQLLIYLLRIATGLIGSIND